jgi:carboxyl-terminal processing protease
VLLLLLSMRARAEEPGAFDRALAAQVFTAAFMFMTPRTLVPVPVPRMTEWGLHGITALDPNLTTSVQNGAAVLSGPTRVLATLKLPAAGDIAGWGELVSAINDTAWRHSPALRRAGTQGVIESFFDEVFNHLDPYSRYVPPQAALADRDWRRGAAGIGVSLAADGTGIGIAEVVPESPADRAGLRAGEAILAVNGGPITHADTDSVLGLLSGDPGTSVAVTVRERFGRARTVTIVRAQVPADTVASSLTQGVLVLRVTGFTGSTALLLHDTLAAAMAAAKQPNGVVLDLRGNRGGLLRQAVDAANLLLSRGVIATTLGRNPDADHQWEAQGPDLADGLPVVVLVDGRTASAAEILAAALSDDARAVVVGSTTLGKGLVQTIGPMPDGGELFVTWSRVLAPDGWPLQGLGVMPEVCTSLGADETQRQLDALSQGSNPGAARLALHRHARPNTPLAEILTIRNQCPADLGHDSDMAAALTLIGNPLSYAAALAPF